MLAGAILATAALLVSPASRAEVADWNQERVANLAVELAVAVKDLREEVRIAPDGGLASAQSRARHRLLDELRLIRTETRHLAAELQAGAGREETLPVYERLGRLARDARENARRMMLPDPVQAKMAVAQDLWRRLTPYYDPDWKTGPDASADQ